MKDRGIVLAQARMAILVALRTPRAIIFTVAFPLILLGEADAPDPALWSRVIGAIGWAFLIWGIGLYLWAFVLYVIQLVLVVRQMPKVT